jgi:hypothetical protein
MDYEKDKKQLFTNKQQFKDQLRSDQSKDSKSVKKEKTHI